MQGTIMRAAPSQARVVPLIVHSHLRWDFVWQRPQQLLTRFAKNAPVFFLEEPMFADDIDEGTLDITVPHPNVYRAVPRLPATFRSDYDAAIAQVRTLALSVFGGRNGTRGALGERFDGAVQWFYTPMPAPAMLGAFHESGVVYDCMDELSQFRFAHPDLVRREQLLMAHADVVFTGGYRLWKAKSAHHSDAHYFGCGVDASHFAKARDPRTSVPADIARIAGPIAGYYGVIDERLDYDLIARLASGAPHLSVVMIGPTAKVDPRDLPDAPNIHWLGARPYNDLPNYVKRFDVCLMPFALNGATEYINPTKTLEYMAAGKPVISTAVADVVHNFTPVVQVAHGADEFATAVAAAIVAPDPIRIADGIRMARSATWESIVSEMGRIIGKKIGTRMHAPHVERLIERVAERITERAAERVPDAGAAVTRASA